MKVLEFIKETIGKSLATVLVKLFDAAKIIAELLLTLHKTKQEKELSQKQKEKEDKIDSIANNGTIDDLLDLGKGKL